MVDFEGCCEWSCAQKAHCLFLWMEQGASCILEAVEDKNLLIWVRGEKDQVWVRCQHLKTLVYTLFGRPRLGKDWSVIVSGWFILAGCKVSLPVYLQHDWILVFSFYFRRRDRLVDSMQSSLAWSEKPMSSSFLGNAVDKFARQFPFVKTPKNVGMMIHNCSCFSSSQSASSLPWILMRSRVGATLYRCRLL